MYWNSIKNSIHLKKVISRIPALVLWRISTSIAENSLSSEVAVVRSKNINEFYQSLTTVPSVISKHPESHNKKEKDGQAHLKYHSNIPHKVTPQEVPSPSSNKKHNKNYCYKLFQRKINLLYPTPLETHQILLPAPPNTK